MTVSAGSGRRGLLLAALALLVTACSSGVGIAPSSRAVASGAAGLAALDFRAVTLDGAVNVSTPAFVGAFLAYARGMGIVALALAVAAARTSVVRGMRRAGAVIGRLSGGLLAIGAATVLAASILLARRLRHGARSVR